MTKVSSTQKKLFIQDIRDGQQISDCFLLARKSLGETRAGKPYLAMTLMDRSGEIEARVWEKAEELNRVADVGDIVLLQGVARPYQNRVQMNVSGLRRLAMDEVRMEDFMPASSRSLEEMKEELMQRIGEVHDQDLKRLLRALFQGRLLERFVLAPAAKRMHHAYLGGLLEHSLSVTGLVSRLCDHYPQLDRDLLVTGALVHDIAKTREFRYDRLPYDYTDCGRLVGHLVLGAQMIEEAARHVETLPRSRLDQVLHLVLSHHGRHEFGAPVLPQTPEAIVLHLVDDMDAKMQFIDQLRGDRSEPGWSDYQPMLERFLYLSPLPAKTPATERQARQPEKQLRSDSAAGSGRKNSHGQDDPASRQQRLF